MMLGIDDYVTSCKLVVAVEYMIVAVKYFKLRATEVVNLVEHI